MYYIMHYNNILDTILREGIGFCPKNQSEQSAHSLSPAYRSPRRSGLASSASKRLSSVCHPPLLPLPVKP